MRHLGWIVLAALGAGCGGATHSTEVGVRTCALGVLESRGHQQVYEPGGVYFFLPIVNEWTTLPTSQQNLLMNASPTEGDRPVPDDIAFKTKDGNNVFIDVNVMWRIDPRKADVVVSRVGSTIGEIKERIVRPLSRSVIRDVFNEITSEEYYHVTVKNERAEKARALLQKALGEYGILVDMLQVQQHRFDKEYQAAINAQKQAEADVQTLKEQQKSMGSQKSSELEGKRVEWNRKLADAEGEAGKERAEADGYFQTKSNQAKATLAVAQADAEGIRKEAEALCKLGGDAYVKMQLAKQFAKHRVMLVPQSNVASMNVNKVIEQLTKQAAADRAEAEK